MTAHGHSGAEPEPVDEPVNQRQDVNSWSTDLIPPLLLLLASKVKSIMGYLARNSNWSAIVTEIHTHGETGRK